MTARVTPPFRADHVGSLLRPASLLADRFDFTVGRIDAGDLSEAEDAAIRDAVAMQESVGLKSATDGEFRREQWHSDFIYALGGIRKGPLMPMEIQAYTRDKTIGWRPNATEITGKVHLADGKEKAKLELIAGVAEEVWG